MPTNAHRETSRTGAGAQREHKAKNFAREWGESIRMPADRRKYPVFYGKAAWGIQQRRRFEAEKLGC